MKFDLASLMKKALDDNKKYKEPNKNIELTIKENCLERFKELGLMKEGEAYHYHDEGIFVPIDVDVADGKLIMVYNSDVNSEGFILTPAGYYLSGKHYPDHKDKGCVLFKKSK